MEFTLEQAVEYLKQFDGKYYRKDGEQEVITATDKIANILKCFGFNYASSFNMRMGDFKKKKDTSWFYRFKKNEHDYTEIQIGYIIRTKTYGRGRNKKTYITGFEGICRVSEVVKEINPATGRPYQIGDIKHVNANYSLMLTERGWYSGD
ncbi:hypothetical protein [Bacillus thuringiensis]|uniref:hypothetical protein n=1 Tax=Bacillus thuringiensis TaxID=1428 RepID=UPI000BFDE2A5|nr:hypothetical protein [Bacillus thuringiensis]PGT90079.1 hypothetical protein COD17_10035 [Bacillus thuringiensis]